MIIIIIFDIFLKKKKENVLVWLDDIDNSNENYRIKVIAILIPKTVFKWKNGILFEVSL